MAVDPYATLGVPRDASAEDIKKAYRRLSKEWHPDRHKGDKTAETKFKQINEAYETVGDPEKRRTYDQFGRTTGQAGQAGSGGFDFSGFQSSGGFGDFADIFQNFFGSQGGRASQSSQDGDDRQVEATIDLADTVTGKRVSVTVKRYVACETCGGNGAEKDAKIVTCETCGGTGQVTRTAQSFFGQIQQRAICATCRGAGKVPERPCKKCDGEGRVAEKSELTIDIPAGIDDGQTLRIRGQGDTGRLGAAAGDLFVTVHVRSDARFEREGADIRSIHKIPVLTAILGGEATVPTLQGDVTLTIPEGTQPNQVYRLKGKGLPILGSSRMGDHYVTIQVEVPTKLSRAERKVLEEWKEVRE
jgi:molecular chaperone DnaJ